MISISLEASLRRISSKRASAIRITNPPDTIVELLTPLHALERRPGQHAPDLGAIHTPCVDVGAARFHFPDGDTSRRSRCQLCAWTGTGVPVSSQTSPL